MDPKVILRTLDLTLSRRMVYLPFPKHHCQSRREEAKGSRKERGWREHPSTHSALATGTRGLISFPDLLAWARVAAEGIQPEAQDQGSAPSSRVPTKPRGRLVFPHTIIMKSKVSLRQVNQAPPRCGLREQERSWWHGRGAGTTARQSRGCQAGGLHQWDRHSMGQSS